MAARRGSPRSLAAWVGELEHDIDTGAARDPFYEPYHANGDGFRRVELELIVAEADRVDADVVAVAEAFLRRVDTPGDPVEPFA